MPYFLKHAQGLKAVSMENHLILAPCPHLDYPRPGGPGRLQQGISARALYDWWSRPWFRVFPTKTHPDANERTREESNLQRQVVKPWTDFANFVTPIGQLVLYTS